jgi:hypothetical protein
MKPTPIAADATEGLFVTHLRARLSSLTGAELAFAEDFLAAPDRPEHPGEVGELLAWLERKNADAAARAAASRIWARYRLLSPKEKARLLAAAGPVRIERRKRGRTWFQKGEA